MYQSSIAFLLGDYTTFGGVERVTATLMKLFISAGMDSKLLISVQGKPGCERMFYPPNTIVTLLNQSQDGKFTLVDRLAVVLKDKQVGNLVFPANNVTFTNAVLEASRRANCRPIPVFHGSVYASLTKFVSAQEFYQKPKLMLSALVRKILYPWKKLRLYHMLRQCYAGVVTVSQGCADEIQQLFPVLTSKKVPVFSVINPLPFSVPEDHASLLNNKCKEIVFAARLERTHKNAFMVIKSWEKIARKYSDWSLRILGDGSLRDEMEQYTQQHKIPGVHFEGFVKNMANRFYQSAITVLTSDYEGLSMVLVEAALFKNALISTRSYGGVSDIIEDGQTGLFVEKHRTEQMAEAISRLIDNQALRHQLAESVFTRVIWLCDCDTALSVWRKLLAINN